MHWNLLGRTKKTFSHPAPDFGAPFEAFRFLTVSCYSMLLLKDFMMLYRLFDVSISMTFGFDCDREKA